MDTYHSVSESFEVARVPSRRGISKSLLRYLVATLAVCACVVAFAFRSQSLESALVTTRTISGLTPLPTSRMQRGVEAYGVSFGTGINERISKRERRMRRKLSIRKKISGTADNPRLSVFRSNKHIYGQLIDDELGHTLAAAGTVEKQLKDQFADKTPREQAEIIGKLIAERAKEKGIETAKFDRNGLGMP
ncbi:hypothetical protein AAMO2058_001254000 [Amorphochlora amoebiformis]